MKWLFFLFALPVLAQDPPTFDAICSTCSIEIKDQPALTIRTNSLEPIRTGVGMTNIHVTVTLPCDNKHTNDYQSEILSKVATATHVYHPRMPHRVAQPSIPPLPPGANRVVTVVVPDGYEVHVSPVKKE